MTSFRVPALVAFSLIFAGCTLDASKLEKGISEKLEKEGLHVENVTCPKDRKIKEGDEFTCEGTEKDGEDFTVDVTQKKGGDVSWEMQEKFLPVSKVKKHIADKTGGKVDVDCEADAFIIAKGRKITCKVEVDGKKSKIQLTMNDTKGDEISLTEL